MPRFHSTSEGHVPFTQEEEDAADARDAIYNSQAEQDKRFNLLVDASRASQYPSVGDQLSAIWEVLEELRPRNTMPPNAKAILDNIDAVNAAHPKR